MRRVVWLTVIFCGLLAVACSSAPPSGETEVGAAKDKSKGAPGETVERFFEHLNRGEYTEAMALYDSKTLDVFEDDPDGSSFATWAAAQSKDGTLDEVKILLEAAAAESANVEFELVYADGSTKRGKTTLTREGEAWKMGLVF
jgi:hypothetical protein